MTPEKDVSNISRSSILLYNVEFTNTGRINKASKEKIIATLKSDHPKLYAKLSKDWREDAEKEKTKGKKKARTR